MRHLGGLRFRRELDLERERGDLVLVVVIQILLKDSALLMVKVVLLAYSLRRIESRILVTPTNSRIGIGNLIP